MIPVNDLAVGDKVRLAHGGRELNWWDVRARDERFVILTRQAPFRPKGEVEYTIIDTVRDLRGPCNLIGQGWHETMPDEECERLLTALQNQVKFTASAGHPGRIRLTEAPRIEVSYRNNVPILVTARKAA